MRQDLLAGNNVVTKQDSNIAYTQATPNYYGTPTINSTKIKYPVFLPTTYTFNNISISDVYALSKELKAVGNPYGFTNKIDTHQMKDSEWGAVVYLAHSKYGRNGEEVTKNNVYTGGTNKTSGMTGYAGGSISAAQVTGTGSSYAWNTINGYKASTTNNAYGIYDLNGGIDEYTAGYVNNGSSTLTTYGFNLYNDGGTGNSTEYKTVWKMGNLDNAINNYNANSERKGEAIFETSVAGNSISSWFGDYSGFTWSDTPFSRRGGNLTYTTIAGLFAFDIRDGNANNLFGFRMVLMCE